jgi:hypothetical protein
MTPAISVAGLTRRYRGELALDDVTFDLESWWSTSRAPR